MAQFDGFVTRDFEGDITHPTWRRRNQLGGALADALTSHTGERYQSWAIYRRPDLYVAPIYHFGGKANEEAGLPRSKLFVTAKPAGLNYGFYIEKGYADGRAAESAIQVMDDTWDWHALA